MLNYLLWCFLVCQFAQGSETLQILTVEEPPSSFLNDKYLPDGFSVEVVQELQKRVQDQTKIQIVPELRALKIASENPNVLLFSFSKTPERAEEYHWITLLVRKPWVIYANKDSALEFNELNEAQRQRTIGVVRGDVRAFHLRNLGFKNLDYTDQHEQNIRKLAANRVQMIFYEPEGMMVSCQKLGIPIEDFKEVYRTEPSEVYLMMSKKGTSLSLVEKWQKAAEEMKKDGTFARIAQKWSNIIFEKNKIQSKVFNGALNY